MPSLTQAAMLVMGGKLLFATEKLKDTMEKLNKQVSQSEKAVENEARRRERDVRAMIDKINAANERTRQILDSSPANSAQRGAEARRAAAAQNLTVTGRSVWDKHKATVGQAKQDVRGSMWEYMGGKIKSAFAQMDYVGTRMKQNTAEEALAKKAGWMGVAKALGVVVGVVAAVVTAMIGLHKKAREWTDAINPNAVYQMDVGFRELQATMGQAFVPYMRMLGEAFRDVAAIIDPMVQRMAGVMATYATFIGSILNAVARLWVAISDALTPVMEALYEILIPIIDILADGAVMIGAFLQVLKPAFQVLIDVMHGLAIAMKVVELVFRRAAEMLSGKSMTPGRTNNQGMINPQVTGFQQIGNALAQSSFMVGQGERQGDTHLAEIEKTAKEILEALKHPFSTGMTAITDRFSWKTIALSAALLPVNPAAAMTAALAGFGAGK